jgi:hypothetical protein
MKNKKMRAKERKRLNGKRRKESKENIKKE